MKSKTRVRLRLSEVLRVVELTPIRVGTGGEDLKFRIELIRTRGTTREVRARVWRHETFRLRPSFPVKRSGEPRTEAWDKELLIQDEAYHWDGITGKTADQVLRKVLAVLKDLLMV